MGRKRKKRNNTNTIGIIVIIIAIAVYTKMTILKDFNFLEEIQNLNIKMPTFERKIKVTERSVKEDYSEIQPELQKEQAKEKNNITQQKSIKKADKYVKIFFTKSSNGQDVYVALPRIKNGNKCSDIEYAVKTLLNGPTSSEKKNGIYSEIPSKASLGTSTISSKSEDCSIATITVIIFVKLAICVFSSLSNSYKTS